VQKQLAPCGFCSFPPPLAYCHLIGTRPDFSARNSNRRTAATAAARKKVNEIFINQFIRKEREFGFQLTDFPQSYEC
jgi:hypothetical protein